jgi:hypothetical protein
MGGMQGISIVTEHIVISKDILLGVLLRVSEWGRLQTDRHVT